MSPKEKCIICGNEIKLVFKPMKEWSINGSLCGNCYSRKIYEHYPGKHARVNNDK